MAVGELEVTIDAHGVHVSVSFAQSALDLTVGANRKRTHSAVMALGHERESHGTCLTAVSFIELTLVDNLKLHGQILKVLALPP